jgi:hypothetical protein
LQDTHLHSGAGTIDSMQAAVCCLEEVQAGWRLALQQSAETHMRVQLSAHVESESSTSLHSLLHGAACMKTYVTRAEHTVVSLPSSCAYCSLHTNPPPPPTQLPAAPGQCSPRQLGLCCSSCHPAASQPRCCCQLLLHLRARRRRCCCCYCWCVLTHVLTLLLLLLSRLCCCCAGLVLGAGTACR